MNFDQLAGLIKAGFNEEQIRSIGSIMDGATLSGAARSTGTSTNTGTNTNTPTPTPTATPTPAAQSAPNSVTPPASATPSTPAASRPASGDTGTTANSTGVSATNAESETVTLLKEMLGLIQKGNINSVGTGTMSEQTGADVLAEILNPTPKTK